MMSIKDVCNDVNYPETTINKDINTTTLIHHHPINILVSKMYLSN